MSYAIRAYRSADGPLPSLLQAPADAPPAQVVVNLSDHACLFFRITPNIGSADTGHHAPRYWFRLGQVVHASRELDIYTVNGTLLLGNDLTGATELSVAGAAGLGATYKDAANALARHLATRNLPRTATGFVLPVCVSAMAGIRLADGSSPFWQGLGYHFCGPLPADTLDATWRARIASLLPRHPVYTSFLGEGEAAIGGVHFESVPLFDALVHAGFRRSNYIDVVDGGPVLEWR